MTKQLEPYGISISDILRWLNTEIEILPPRLEVVGTTVTTIVRSREIVNGIPGTIKELRTSTIECGNREQTEQSVATLTRINQ